MMLKFIRKCVLTKITFFSYNVLNLNSLECVLKNNQKYKVRPEIINVYTNE